MIKRFEELLARLGLKRASGLRSFALEAGLRSVLVELAEQEGRPAEEVQADLLRTALAQRQAHEDLWQRWQALSPREQDVAAFTCLGYTNRQIASKLCVSPDTVKGYVRQVLVKFNMHSKDELRMQLAHWDFSRWGSEAQDKAG
jgi:DNA-binding NarL/FixJ family response regulator